ncbi:MAG: peptidyl-prolyl cis-trans isomerase [Candidatus Omnitrophica bacterium]|nr:peptidyl-prolyl cis-trans isomerase [Candidatus Omnitrophota bacterium]
MKKNTTVTYGVMCLAFGLVFLTGCDLLGLGPKKQEEQKKQPVTTVAAVPVAQSSQEAPGPIPGDVLVRIGKWTLTTQEFNNRLGLLKQQLPAFKENDPNSKNAVLEELVRQQLLVKEADDTDIGNTKEIKDAVEDFRKTLLVQEIASRLTKDVMATEEDARVYYEANKDKMAEPVTWNVRQIVVGDEAAAKGILVQVLQGGDFAQIAQAQSKGTNAAEGGKIKPFMTGRAPFDAMQTAIFNLEVGGVSGVFKGPEGYYIVKVDSKTGGTVKPFADLKKELIYDLTMQKQQEVLLKHLKELAEKNKPEYNKELIEQAVGKVSSN